jgi:hypothetical protein
MRSIRLFLAFTAVSLLALPPLSRALADEPSDQTEVKAGKAAKAEAATGKNGAKDDEGIPEVNLLDAMRDRMVSVKAEGIGDGRMTLSVTNRTGKKLRVVLPPGIIAQGATGQFGGMGGMGGGGMGGGMGGGGMGGGGMGGMGGGGMGGMGGQAGGMGGMGGMGRQAGTMPPTMGMMMLSRMIMYFCGDPDSWDPRSIMIGMMGGMMGGMGGGGMMGGMGGGGMGGMGGGMGGGGMRSVAPTELPSAVLNRGQTRHLPTRLVSVNSPDPESGLSLPEKGEELRIVGDIARVSDDPKIQKALRRLAADKAPTAMSQLVMWRLAGLDWETIERISDKWASASERTLAKDFVARLDKLPEGDTGRVLFQLEAAEASGESAVTDFKKVLKNNMVLGLTAEVCQIPARPEGPAVACRVKFKDNEAAVQVLSTDALAQSWQVFGKYSVPVKRTSGKFQVERFADELADGMISRLVRAQKIEGTARDKKGKLLYQVRIDNASPLILNGIALLGTTSTENEVPNVLTMISIAPRKSLTVPMSEQVVRTLGLKKGIRVVALDLSGL